MRTEPVAGGWRRGHSWWRALPLLAAGGAVLLAGCASMPTSGAVREAAEGNAAEQPGTGSDVLVFANPPQRGMTQTQIINGFLDAMNSVEPDFATAKQYLAAPDDWDPSARVRVYDESVREVRPNRNGSGYLLETVRVGEVGPDGAYHPAAPGSQLNLPFDLVRVGDEWRIDHPPDGVLLSNLDFTREYVSTDEPIDLYFFDPTYRVLVPDPIYLPKRADLLTAVTEAVLHGPTDRLDGAVVSAVPKGTRLAVRPVTVINGQITVRLDRAAANLDEAQRQLLTAQLVWSLSGVSEGSSILVTADGVPLYPQPTTTAAWDVYRPSLPSAELERIYLLRDDVLMAYDSRQGGEPQRVPAGGSDGDELEPLSAFAVSAGTGEVAGVSTDRTRLIRARLDLPRDEPTPLMQTATKLESPSWDRFGGLWVLDQRESGSRVYFFDEAGRHDVAVAGLGDRRIKSLAVASDGTRVALITQQPNGEPRLELGLVRSSSIEPGAPDPRRGVRPVSIVELDLVTPQLDTALDVAWLDPQRLVVLIRDTDTNLVQPFEIGVDGRMPEPLGPVAGEPVTVAAGGPDVPILVGTDDDDIWELSTSTGPAPTRFWRPLPGLEGTSPAYAG